MLRFGLLLRAFGRTYDAFDYAKRNKLSQMIKKSADFVIQNQH